MSQQQPRPPMQSEQVAKDRYTWATRAMSQAIAGILIIISILGVVLAMHDIQAINSMNRLFGTTKSKFPSSSNNSPFDDFASNVQSKVDSAFAQILIYLYILIAACGLQSVVCILGMVSIAKQMIGVYKVYFFTTSALLVVRLVLAFLLRGTWYMILSVIVQLAVVYPMWAYLKNMQSLFKGDSAMQA